MNMRTTVALGAVALTLAIFIIGYEQHMLSSGEVEERRGRLLERFVRNRVTGFEIFEGEESRVKGVRERDDQEELGSWRLLSPLSWPADEDSVSMMLNALEYADARRTLEGVTAEDRRSFGLEEPRLMARFDIANEQLELRFGHDDPTGGGLYMMGNDRTTVWIVGTDLFEAVDHGVDHFRSKRLLETGVNEAIALGLPQGTLFKDESGQWRYDAEGSRIRTRASLSTDVRRDVAGSLLASRGRVEEALQTLTDLVAERFVSDEPDDLAPYGLDEPEANWVAVVEDEPVRVLVGSPCEQEGERHVRVDDGPVACVLDSSFDALRRPTDEWRELRPLTVNDLELERLVMEQGGDRIELEDRDGSWQVKATIGASSTESPADDQALAEWLREIRGARAKEIVVVDEAGLRTHGLDRPRAMLSLSATDERTEVLHVGQSSVEGVYVRRGDEMAVLVLEPEVAPALELSLVRLRKRRILDLDRGDLTHLGITRANGIERIENVDDTWRVLAPIEAPADTGVVRNVARQLAELEAESFVADSPDSSHGLERPRVVVSGRFGEEEVTLRIGAETEGGAFAKLERDSAVFVVDEDLVAQLSHPLVSHDVFDIEELDLEAIVIERGSERIELMSDGGTWKLGQAAIAAEQIDPLITALEGLTAAATTAYGPPTATDGFSPPRVRLHIRRDAEPAELEILIGAPTGESGRAHLRRADLAVGFTAAIPEALFDFTL